MVSSSPSRPALSLSSSPRRSRSLVIKGTRRLLRTLRTEARLFLARPTRRRPWTFPLLFLLALISILFLLRRRTAATASPELDREAKHFSHDVHRFVPHQPSFSSAQFQPCSWRYLEFGARGGKHVDAFLAEGDAFLEELLRATTSAMRAFCVVAFEPDAALDPLLQDVRSVRGRKARSLHLYSGVVPGAVNATEAIHVGEQKALVQSLNVRDAVLRLTFPWEQSGKEVGQMLTARGNGNLGAVVVRFNVWDTREAFWMLDLLDGTDAGNVMCDRIDRLVLNLKRVDIDTSRFEVDDRPVVRDWEKLIPPPSHPRLDGSKGLAGLVDVATEVNARPGCRTIVHLFDESGSMLMPKMLSERQVHYAILAGQPTFDERVGAQTESWMTAVPQDRLTVFTNAARNADEMAAARGRDVVVTQPHNPSLEQRLPMMQSWSHLVRVRESWDRTMRDNKEIQWLALVDDDTFVFPGGMREYLSKFDWRHKVWGGSGEQARIDNGDAGVFATWLRKVHMKHGGKHCYLRTEEVPDNLQGSHMEYGVSSVMNGRKVAHKVSHMCHDMFCRFGCPAVPQGAAIVLSRTLVEALRPHIEQCEADTAGLCASCGSQRLYMCVNRYAGPARTLLTRGICRAPWNLEHRERFPFALTFHGFQRYKGLALSTDSIRGDMVELWQLGKVFEEGAKRGLKKSYFVPMQKVADLIGCHGQGVFQGDECVTGDGIKLAGSDKKGASQKTMKGQRPGDRKGSA